MALLCCGVSAWLRGPRYMERSGCVLPSMRTHGLQLEKATGFGQGGKHDSFVLVQVHVVLANRVARVFARPGFSFCSVCEE